MNLFEYFKFPFKIYENHKDYNKLIENYGNDFVKDLETHKELKMKHGDLEKKLEFAERYPGLKERLEILSEEINKFRVTKGEMYENSRKNYSANKSLEKWKEGHLKILNNKFDAVKSAAFSVAISALLDSNKNMQRVPFIYYDMNNQNVIATDAAYELLEVQERPDKLSLRNMLSYINKENWDGIIDSLRHKKKLRNYNVVTSNSKDLKMAINFYDYNNKTFGAGVSMYQKGFAKSAIPRLKFARKFNHTLKKVESEFKEVYNLLRREKSEIQLLIEANS